MSAFVVEKRTIDAVVNLWDPHYRQCDEVRDAFGRELWQMNVDAVNTRYPQDKIEPPEDYKNAYPTRFGEQSPAMLKALNCLIYQCAEGDIPKRALFTSLQDLSRQVANRIVEQMPDYAAAETWC